MNPPPSCDFVFPTPAPKNKFGDPLKSAWLEVPVRFSFFCGSSQIERRSPPTRPCPLKSLKKQAGPTPPAKPTLAAPASNEFMNLAPGRTLQMFGIAFSTRTQTNFQDSFEFGPRVWGAPKFFSLPAAARLPPTETFAFAAEREAPSRNECLAVAENLPRIAHPNVWLDPSFS